MTEARPDLSVVVLSWNTSDLLRTCLERVRACDPAVTTEVIVVDNASDDDSADMVAREFPECRLIRNPRNFGYAEGNNVGVRAASGRHVFLLNSDTEVFPDAPRRLVEFLDANPGYGAVGAHLLNLDGTTQRACMRFPTPWVAVGFDTWFGDRWPFRRVIDRYFHRDFDHEHSRDVDQPPAAALVVPRRVFDEVGLLDPDLFLFFNDVELCQRIRKAGYFIRYLADAKVTHHGGASTRRFASFALEWHRNRARYYLRAFGRPGFALAKVMTFWRSLEEWVRSARALKTWDERRRAWGVIQEVVREVWRDEGRGDPRVRG